MGSISSVSISIAGGELDLSASRDYALRPAPGEYTVEETPDNYHLALDLGKEGLRLLYRRMRFKESGPATLFGENLAPGDAFAGVPHREALEDLVGLATRLRVKGWRLEGILHPLPGGKSFSHRDCAGVPGDLLPGGYPPHECRGGIRVRALRS